MTYLEIQNYESNAAVSQKKKTDFIGFCPDQVIQYAADTIDHNIRKLDGHNTFHGMGMLACITPDSFSIQFVPRQNVSTEQLVSAVINDIKFLKQYRICKLQMKVRNSTYLPK